MQIGLVSKHERDVAHSQSRYILTQVGLLPGHAHDVVLIQGFLEGTENIFSRPVASPCLCQHSVLCIYILIYLFTFKSLYYTISNNRKVSHVRGFLHTFAYANDNKQRITHAHHRTYIVLRYRVYFNVLFLCTEPSLRLRK